MLERFPKTGVSLTNEVRLPGLHVQDDEADQASQRGNDTEREGEVDGGFVRCLHSWEKEERECVDYTTSSVEVIVQSVRCLLTEQVRRQVHGKIEAERQRCVEHTASALLLRPLDRHRDTAVEGVHPKHNEVGGADVSSHNVYGLAKRGTTGREDSPVESQHADLGEAHAYIVEVV